MELTLERSEEGHGNLCPMCNGTGWYWDYPQWQEYAIDCDTCTDGQLWELPSEEEVKQESERISSCAFASQGFSAKVFPKRMTLSYIRRLRRGEK